MSAKLIRSFYNVTPNLRGGVITLGNFDGVHLGHQALVKQVVNTAKDQQIPHLVITFEPHPFEFFEHNRLSIPRLTRLREKFLALSHYGAQNVLVLRFNQALASTRAEAFIDLLVNNLAPRLILIGDDFHFGYKREGDFNLLQKKGKLANFEVAAIPTLSVLSERVSSTRVRKALADDNLALAERLLGRPFTMQGRVSHGDRLGREWGFPTANLFLHRALTPVHGVYAVKMHGIADHPLPGVANVGVRPTVGGTRCLLEVHLFDFNQQIYGRYVSVEFCKKLRNEVRYPNVDLLKAQIAKDAVEAKKYFEEKG